MKEMIDTISDKVKFQKKQQFSELLTKCIHVSYDLEKSTYATNDNIVFKMDTFFQGFSSFQYEFGRDRNYEAGVEALSVIYEELGLKIDKEECFLLFHLRNLGKFRMKESTLHNELKVLWKQYKDYALDDQDFSYTLKSLMKNKLIDYRKGNLSLKRSIIFRYRN